MFNGNEKTGLISYSIIIDGKTHKSGNVNYISYSRFNYMRPMEKLIAKDFFEDNGWIMDTNGWKKS